MAPICLSCDQPVRDVSDQLLARVRETQRGQCADAVYFCSRRCKYAWIQVEGELEPVDRRWVEGLET